MAVKRSLSTALLSLLFAMGCSPGLSAASNPAAQGNGVLRILTCDKTAPFITALLIGRRTAQGYPVEIKGLACANDGLNVAVHGGGVNLTSAGGAVATAAGTSTDPNEGVFDINLFYNGKCGKASANLTFEISTQGLTSEKQPREVDMSWGQEGLSCLP